MDTIFALSSGQPPAAIAVMRISGPAAFDMATRLGGTLPPPRQAAVRALRDGNGDVLDRALVIAFPGPNTATGEDLVEFHLHGGRAIVRAVEEALAGDPALRPAVAGEFTRRALANGVIDLAQAEGLADLLEAETEGQRRQAIAASEGAISRRVRGWLDAIAAVAAQVEALLDFSDEGDVTDEIPADFRMRIDAVGAAMAATMAVPPVDRLRDGVVVVLAGPPNVGKSSLFNALLDRDAAIVTDVAGTTRDVLEATVTRDGLPFRLLDTAGLRDTSEDHIELIGVARARLAADQADIVLWLGDAMAAPDGAIVIRSKADLTMHAERAADSIATSIFDPLSIRMLWDRIAANARDMLPREHEVALNRRQRGRVAEAQAALEVATETDDLILVAEHLRQANVALSALMGVSATEVMLDALFARFCVGK